MAVSARPKNVFQAQTSILRWLHSLGHRVDLRSEETGYDNRRWITSMHKWDGATCPYCDGMMLLGTPKFPTRDHVRPRRAGGTLAPDNILIVCAPCNNDKGDLMLEEFYRNLYLCHDPRAEHVQRVMLSGADRFAMR